MEGLFSSLGNKRPILSLRGTPWDLHTHRGVPSPPFLSHSSHPHREPLQIWPSLAGDLPVLSSTEGFGP